MFERYNINASSIDIYSPDYVPTVSGSTKLSKQYLLFKIFLLICNLLFVVFGIILIGVGSYALNSSARILISTNIASGIIAMGVFTVLLSILGAFSAWREHRWGLIVYFVVLLVITICLFSIAIAVYTQRNSADDVIQQAWKNIYNSTSPDRWTALSNVQNAFNCCGLYTYNDSWTPQISATNPNQTCAVGSTSACKDIISSNVSSAFQSAGGVGIAFAVLMGSMMGTVCCMVEGIRKMREKQMLEKNSMAQQQQQQQQQGRVEDYAGGPMPLDREANNDHDEDV